MSLCSDDMHCLLNICDQYAKEHDLIFNSAKTQCMVFKPRGVLFDNPYLKLSDDILHYVECAKYLGTYIELNGHSRDIKRQICKLYGNANRLISKFKLCSPEVKCQLFNSFCTNMYCPQFWYNGTKCSINKLKVAYNNSLRRLLNIPYYSSASSMFVNLNISSFNELLRHSINNFCKRLMSSNNMFLQKLCTVHIIFNSPIHKWWRKLVYT